MKRKKERSKEWEQIERKRKKNEIIVREKKMGIVVHFSHSTAMKTKKEEGGEMEKREGG